MRPQNSFSHFVGYFWGQGALKLVPKSFGNLPAFLLIFCAFTWPLQP